MVLMFFAIRLARLARLASEHCYTSLMSKILRLISIVSVLAQSVSFLTKHCWFLRREKKMMLNLFKVPAHKFDTCKGLRLGEILHKQTYSGKVPRHCAAKLVSGPTLSQEPCG